MDPEFLKCLFLTLQILDLLILLLDNALTVCVQTPRSLLFVLQLVFQVSCVLASSEDRALQLFLVVFELIGLVLEVL